MRQIGTLPDSQSAHTLADYLRNRSIETRVQQEGGLWSVWVCDEDRVTQAREELQAFQRSPQDERFRAGALQARKRRAEEEKAQEPARPGAPARRAAGPPQRQLTLALIVASVLVTLMYLSGDSQEARESVEKNLFITSIHPRGDKVFFQPGLPEIWQRGEIWRLVTPIFIHFGPWHLLFDMLWLAYLGSQIERRYGPWRLAALVVFIAAVSNVCQYYFADVGLQGWKPVLGQPRPYFGGMSGVVFGLFGFIWMKVVYDRSSELYISPGNILLMVFWLILCMTGLIGPIANAAHLAGLAVGMVVGYASAWWNGFGAWIPEETATGEEE
jgi:rhomboid protease GlpG